MAVLQQCAGILVILVIGCQANNSYKIVKSFNDADGFDITLTCQDKLFGSLHNITAVFYRNGADLYTDLCLNNSVYKVENDSIKLMIISECDGYYMCGVNVNNNMILSEPYTIYAKPAETGNGTKIHILIEEGESVKLPCKVSSSPINTYTTTWYKYYNGEQTELTTMITHGDDNSLVLEVSHGEHQGTYYCRVLVDYPEYGTLISSQNNGLIELEIYKKFVSPVFVNDLSYKRNNDKSVHFAVLAAVNNDYPIYYHWEINDTNITGLDNYIDTEFKYGDTKIKVIISNNDYNGKRYLQQQTMYMIVHNTTTTETLLTKKILNIPIIVTISVIAITLVLIISISFIIIIKLCRTTKTAPAKRQSVSSETEMGQIIVKIFEGVGAIVSDQLQQGMEPNDIILNSLQTLILSICTSKTINITDDANKALIDSLRMIQSALMSSINNNGELKSQEYKEQNDKIRTDGETTAMKREKDISESKMEQFPEETSANNESMRETILREIQRKIHELEERQCV